MTLAELITALEAADPERVCPIGFADPHSYRGNCRYLAFEPAANVTVADMLASARSANGTTYEGWKGGDYTMGPSTNVHLATRGECGEEIGPVLLRYMLGTVKAAFTGYLVAVFGVPTADGRTLTSFSNRDGSPVGVYEVGGTPVGSARLLTRLIPRQHDDEAPSRRAVYAVPDAGIEIPDGETLIPNVSGRPDITNFTLSRVNPVEITWTEPVEIVALVIGPSPWPDFPRTVEVSSLEMPL